MAIIDRATANRDVLKACAILGAFFVIATTGGYLYWLDLSVSPPRDGSTLVVGRDFLNFWMYGRAAWLPAPGAWYDAESYQRVLALVLGNDYPGQNWSYPPSIMLLTAPFGRLGYLPALLCWTLLGLAVFLPVAWRYLPNRLAFLAAICAPATIFGLMSGQISFLTTAIMIGVFNLLDRRPVAAGVLIGLLTIKPHVGFLYPVILIASGRWRVFSVAGVTTVVLVALTALLFGIEVWFDFLTLGLGTQNQVLHDPEGIAVPFFPTIYMNLRGLGWTYQAAMAVQIAVAAAAVTMLAWAYRWRAEANPRLLEALFFTCSVAAVPYLLPYGTAALCLSALALLMAGDLDARGRLLTRLVYWLPLLQITFGTFNIPGPALVAPAFGLYIFLRLKSQTALLPRMALQRA